MALRRKAIDVSFSDCSVDQSPVRMMEAIKLRKLVLHFLSNWLGYDRGDSFPFDLEPNGNPFGSKSKGKLSLRSYPYQFERKWNTIFLSARDLGIKWAPNWGPPWSRSVPHCRDVQEQFQRGNCAPLWCEDTSVPRTAARLIAVVFPVWSQYTQSTRFLFPLKLKGIWSYSQFPFWYYKPNGILFGS